jgi:hypothetical protein
MSADIHYIGETMRKWSNGTNGLNSLIVFTLILEQLCWEAYYLHYITNNNNSSDFNLKTIPVSETMVCDAISLLGYIVTVLPLWPVL